MTIIEVVHNQTTIWAEAGRIGSCIVEWRNRIRLRRQLTHISARDLRDAGLSLENVAFEMNRPFWQPLNGERK